MKRVGNGMLLNLSNFGIEFIFEPAASKAASNAIRVLFSCPAALIHNQQVVGINRWGIQGAGGQKTSHLMVVALCIHYLSLFFFLSLFPCRFCAKTHTGRVDVL